jgi:hypothetical protein
VRGASPLIPPLLVFWFPSRARASPRRAFDLVTRCSLVSASVPRTRPVDSPVLDLFLSSSNQVASISTGLSHLRDFYLAAESPSFDFSTGNFPIVSATSVLGVSTACAWFRLHLYPSSVTVLVASSI